MTLLLGIDFETTGLDPQTDRVIEVGMELMDTRNWQAVESHSYLVQWDDVLISPEITKINGITDQMVNEHGYSNTFAFSSLGRLARRAHFFVAHNSPFEQGFLESWCQYIQFELPNLPWIDTKTDIPGHEEKRLIHLAAEHGILNPWPHRALPDVKTMLQVLSHYDINEIIRNLAAPKETLIIAFPYDEFKVKQVKALGGWRWYKEFEQWRKVVKDFQVDAELEKARAAGFTPYIAEKESTHV
jgi:DNA polymerase III subunit epsilon